MRSKAKNYQTVDFLGRFGRVARLPKVMAVLGAYFLVRGHHQAAAC
jgi:hypothetical protein